MMSPILNRRRFSSSLFAVAFFLAAQTASAGPLYLESGLGFGLTNPSVADGADKPTLISYGLGVTMGVRFFGPWMIGATSDFRFIRQYSNVSAAVGNFAGKRFNVRLIGLLSGYFSRFSERWQHAREDLELEIFLIT